MELQKLIYSASEEQPIWFKLLSSFGVVFFWLGISLRSILFDLGLRKKKYLPSFCVSVGNIVLGGTGKTPVIIAMLRYLFAHSVKPVVLSRGYGASLKKSEYLVIKNGKIIFSNEEKSHKIPDESMLLSKTFPQLVIIAGAQRYKAAQQFLGNSGEHFDMWILDDGFQHRCIHRDLDIVLLDAKRPFGNNSLIPRGTLRELEFSLKRAHCIFWTRSGQDLPHLGLFEEVQKRYQKQVFKIPFTPSGFFNPIKNCDIEVCEVPDKVFVVTGIAVPDRLLEDIKSFGKEVVDTYIVSDHQSFSRKIIQEKITYSDCIVTSAKDYWRDEAIFADLLIPVYILKIELKFCFSRIFPSL